MRTVKELEHKMYSKNNRLHIAQWRVLLAIIFLYSLLLLRCSPVHVSHPAPIYEIKLRSSESSGGSANKGYILVDNDLYHFPSEVFLEEGSHIISFVPEGDYNFSYWELIGIEATPPKDEFDNPTLISINGSGEVIAYYDRGEQLEISRVGESGNPIFAYSPINLNVNVTFNGKPVTSAEVTFYVNTQRIGSTETNSDGCASISFVPDEEKIYTWYVTAQKIGFGTASSDEWEFAFQRIMLDPENDEILTELPINLNALIELDGEPIEDARVSYFIDDRYNGYKNTQSNGISSYQIQYMTAGRHTWFVTVRIQDWEPISSETLNFTYIPQLSASLEYPKNNEVITDYTSSIKLVAFIKFDNRPFQEGNVSFYVDGNYAGSNVSDAEGLASFYFTPPREDESYEWYVTASKECCFNDTSPSWSFYYPVQPPYVEVDKIYTSRNRADVDSEQTIGFHLKWENGSDVHGAIVRITDNHEGITDNSGWVNFTVSNSVVGNKIWKIIDVSREGMGEFQHNKYPNIIWDRVSIELSLDENRVDVGSNLELMVNAFYEYDNTIFEGSIFYNTELYSDVVCEKTIRVESIQDNDRGLTAFESNDVNVIWDRVILSLKIQGARVEVGSKAEIDWRGVYEFDQKSFEGSIKFDGDLKQDTLGEKTFSVSEISDSLYNLSVFQCNEVSCIFDDIEVEQHIDAKIPTQVQVLTNVHYKSDNTPVEDATVKVNGIGEYIGSGKYKATIYTFYPLLRLNTEINIEGWEGNVVENITYTLGTLISEALILIILTSVSIRQIKYTHKNSKVK